MNRYEFNTVERVSKARAATALQNKHLNIMESEGL